MSAFRSLDPVRLFCSAILCLFFLRYFYVAESAGQGETLWIVELWFFGFLLWSLIAWKSEASRAPLGWLDFGVWLLVIGHLLSAVIVIATTGDKRTAANFGWEWVGIGCAWFLIRQQCVIFSFRREIVIGTVATGISLAGLGLYQHYVDFPRMATQYGEMFDRLKKADAVEATIIRQKMAGENIPVDGPGGTLFEKRLRDSREPLGVFALANTFGGFLAICLILAASLAQSVYRRGSPDGLKRMLPWMAILLLLGWCLLLTKSRTAWIGGAIGMALFGLQTRRQAIAGFRSKIAGVALIVLVIVGWLLSRAGGLDRQVFTEAPKSLQYRLQYWTATLPMIRDHLLFGVGSGQFRSNYLIYKLPEASEEISDPHNLFLDVAANGGLTAIIGLVVVCASIVASFRQTKIDVSPSTEPSNSPRLIVVAGLAGIAWISLLLNGSDDRLLVLIPVTVALFWGLRWFVDSADTCKDDSPEFHSQTEKKLRKNTNPKMGNSLPTDNTIQDSRRIQPFDEMASVRTGALSAAIGLIVHLCGAGGIEMPAITILLLALIAVSRVDHVMPVVSIRRSPMAKSGIGCVLSLGLMLGLYQTSLRPVILAQDRMVEGDRLMQRGRSDAADSEYAAAARADGWSAEPWRRRAALAYRKAEEQQFRSNESFRTAVRMLNESKTRDPTNFRDDRQLGEWWSARWQKTRDSADALEAVNAFRRALASYPTNAALMADLAFALQSIGKVDEAIEIARDAIRQDVVNHDCQHVDRYLNPATQDRLSELVGDSAGK